MYRILEDESGKFWVAKITKARVILQKGTWHSISRVPNRVEIGYLKDYRKGRTVSIDKHKQPRFY